MATEHNLVDLAKQASTFAYAPYSKFHVGAAGVFANSKDEEKVFTGCNVENASFGGTNCAERTAIFKAVSEGYTKLLAIAVYTPTQTATSPCGICRQIMNEFGPQSFVISACDNPDDSIETTLDELLPFAFNLI